MNEQIKQMIVKSICSSSITEAELERLELLSVHDLMDIIISCGKSGETISETVHYLYSITQHYKQSGGSIHQEKGINDV